MAHRALAGVTMRPEIAMPTSTAKTPDTERSSMDDVIDLYKKDVDRTLLRENLRLTVDERIQKLMSCLALIEEMRRSLKTKAQRA